jgi:hypothetical protein
MVLLYDIVRTSYIVNKYGCHLCFLETTETKYSKKQSVQGP